LFFCSFFSGNVEQEKLVKEKAEQAAGAVALVTIRQMLLPAIREYNEVMKTLLRIFEAIKIETNNV